MTEKDYFYFLADVLEQCLQPGEVFTCFFEAEDSEFVRFNQNRLRQAGNVRQRELHIDLIAGKRHAAETILLSGGMADDRARLDDVVRFLRRQRIALEDDPYLLYATEPCSTESVSTGTPLDARTAISEILDAADGLDLVGLWASGTLYRGFASSLGQRNWYRQSSFHFDWSCYAHDDKAVKMQYAGFTWDPARLREKMQVARAELALVGRAAKTLHPGRYRVYLAPPALHAILEVVAWGGFDLKSHRTLQTPLIKMVRHEARLSPQVTLHEHHAGGLAPQFTASGFMKPERVTLLERGVYRQCLVTPRSGMEYGEPVNAGSEFPESLEMAAGQLPESTVLEALGTGLYINHLWYCNFSDRNDCRITGMTRYACFWVQDGVITAPLNAMRFDESVYHLLGDKLIGLTAVRELLLSADTYHQRSTQSARLPGALIDDLTLTL